MKHFVFLSTVIGMVCGAASGQEGAPVRGALEQADPSEQVVEAEAVPPEVIASAVEAVGKLGKEVELGRYKVAVERMNPLWKKRTAERMGGMKALEAQLAGVAAQMVQQGITILSSRVEGKPIPYEADPAIQSVTENGGVVKKLRNTKWLVLVPTITRFRVFPPGTQRAVMIDSRSFQVAISEKNKLDWTFIDGASLNAGDLRSLFSTLPNDMSLPPVSKQEVR